MDGPGNQSDGDYIDEFSRLLPWQVTLTPFERLLIVLIVSTFLSLVGFTLLCLIFPQCPLRRRFSSKKRSLYRNNEQLILITTAPKKGDPLPPRYESVVNADDIAAYHKLSKSRYLELGRKSSYAATYDSDGVHSNDGNYDPSSIGNTLRSNSVRSSLSNGAAVSTITSTYPLAPYARTDIRLDIDTTKNILDVNLSNCDHFSVHSAFDEQADYFIRIQLINNKFLKKFHDAWRKRHSNLPLNLWKKQQEQTTKNLPHTAQDTLICDENLRLRLEKEDLTSSSLRFLLFCTDRSGIQDLMFEALVRLSPSMVPIHQQTLDWKDTTPIAFGELFLGMSYLPTSERLTINVNKLRYFCKTEKNNKIDVRLTATFFHHGRRFFQQKLPPINLNESFSSMPTSDAYDIKHVITQNIPQENISTVHVHIEFIIRMLHAKEELLVSCGSILLGDHARFESDWHKMLEHPRQVHFGWYPFFG